MYDARKGVYDVNDEYDQGPRDYSAFQKKTDHYEDSSEDLDEKQLLASEDDDDNRVGNNV